MADGGNLKLMTSCEKDAQVITTTSNVSLPFKSFLQVVKGQSSTSHLDSIEADQGTYSAHQHLEEFAPQLKTPSLLQGTPTLQFNVAEQELLVNKLKYVLVGKFSHGRPAWSSVQSFFSGLKLCGPHNLSIFDHKHIYIECSNKCDFNRIWLRLFWSIDGFVMRVFKWGREFSSLIESPIAPVWIQMKGLPLYMFDEMPLLSLSNVIGKPVKIDPRNLKRSVLNIARVCVELDVSKPLLDSFKVNIVEEQTGTVVDGFRVQVVYDVVPPYCASCCHIGHGKDRCKRSDSPGLVIEHKQRAGKEKVIQSESSQNDQEQYKAKPTACKQQWQPVIKKKQGLNIRAEAKQVTHQVTHQVTSVSNSYQLLSGKTSDLKAVNMIVNMEKDTQNGCQEIQVSSCIEEPVIAENHSHYEVKTVDSANGQDVVAVSPSLTVLDQQMEQDFDLSSSSQQEQLSRKEHTWADLHIDVHNMGKQQLDEVTVAVALENTQETQEDIPAVSSNAAMEIGKAVVNATPAEPAFPASHVVERTAPAPSNSKAKGLVPISDQSEPAFPADHVVERTATAQQKDSTSEQQHDQSGALVCVKETAPELQQISPLKVEATPFSPPKGSIVVWDSPGSKAATKNKNDADLQVSNSDITEQNVPGYPAQSHDIPNEISNEMVANPMEGDNQEWQVVKKNYKSKGVITRSQAKISKTTWADRVEKEQNEELTDHRVHPKTQTQEYYTPKLSKKQIKKEMCKLGTRLNNMGLKHKMRGQLEAEFDALQEELSLLS